MVDGDKTDFGKMAGFFALGLIVIVYILLLINGVSELLDTNGAEIDNKADFENVITVTGYENVTVEPDVALISFKINTEGKTPTECQQSTDVKVNSLVAYLKENGISEESIKTSNFYLSEKYDNSIIRDYTQTEVVGYQMNTDIEVKNVLISDIGKLISNGVNSGATGINSVEYQSSKYTEIYNEALKKSLSVAKEKAEVLAAQEGYIIEGVKSIDENGGYSPMNANVKTNYDMLLVNSEAGVESATVQPGELEITSRVTVTYLIKKDTQ